jgi:hypothetical protein
LHFNNNLDEKGEMPFARGPHGNISGHSSVVIFKEHVLMLICYTIITYHALTPCSIIIKRKIFIHSLSKSDKTDLLEKKNETKRLEEEE